MKAPPTPSAKTSSTFLSHDFDYLIILSGDQLYRMDFRPLIAQHTETGADITVATIPVNAPTPRNRSASCKSPTTGASRASSKNPRTPRCWIRSSCTPELQTKLGIKNRDESLLASMGIYVFNRKLICELLDNPLSDFGKHIIPHAIHTHRVFSYVFQGYWEDVGTIRSFFEANLDLVSELPRFNFFDMSAPIFSRPRFLPGSKINGAQIDHAVISDGCIINRARITNTIVGLRTIVERRHGIEPRRHPRQRLLRIAGIRGAARTRRQAAHRHRRQLQNRERHH